VKRRKQQSTGCDNRGGDSKQKKQDKEREFFVDGTIYHLLPTAVAVETAQQTWAVAVPAAKVCFVKGSNNRPTAAATASRNHRTEKRNGFIDAQSIGGFTAVAATLQTAHRLEH